MKKLWSIACRLADNLSSILEGAYIALECMLLALILGAGWAVHEIRDSWSVPLTHKYKEELK